MTLAVLLPLAFAFACTDGDGSRTTQPKRTDDDALAVEVMMSGLTAYPRADFQSQQQVRCVAEGVVGRFGTERLQELGLDVATRTAPMLHVPGLTAPERYDLAAAYEACVDAQGSFVQGLIAEGFSEPEARCVWAGYDATGIPDVHLTEAPHGISTIDTETARAHLDALLEAAKAACRDWL
jgi:hypothetical protein